MIISAIKYQVLHEDKPRLFRFVANGGKLRHFFCHSGKPEELQDFLHALTFGLENQRHPRIVDVVLHINDDSGDAWVIERTQQSCRIFQNRQLIAENSEQVLRHALFDAEVDGVSEKGVPLMQRYELTEEDDHIAAYLQKSSDEAPDLLRVALKKQLDELVGRFQEFLQTKSYIDQATVQKLVEGLEPAHVIWRELVSEQRRELEEERHSGLVNPDMIMRLESEMDLMERLRLKATPLLDPSKSPAMLKEKLLEVENKLKNLCRKNDIQALPANLSEIPWEKVLGLLSRLKAYEQLQAAYDKSQDEIETRVAPLFDDYVATVEQLLQNDTQITAELECCLTTLTMQAKKEESQPAPSKAKWAQWLEKYKGKEPAPTHALMVQATGTKERLENARMAVDYALARLGELHSNLQHAEGFNQDSRNAIRDFHEKLVLEHGKLRKNWQIIAEKYGLPQDTSLKMLLGLIQHFAQVSELWQKAEEIRRELRQYRQELDELEVLVSEWRHVTGSQKETPLSTPSILLGEARGILEYQEQKQTQLRKWKEQEVRLQSGYHIQQSLKRRMSELQGQWRQTFERLALPMKDIQNEGWQEFFTQCHRYLGLSTILRDSLHPIRNEKIFNHETLPSPLSLFMWRKEVAQARSRALLAGLLEKATTTRSGLLLVADAVLAEALAKIGVVTSVPVQPTRKKIEPQPAAKSLMSDRAQAALKVFQTNHRKGFRSEME